jgi:hypothetical protein
LVDPKNRVPFRENGFSINDLHCDCLTRRSTPEHAAVIPDQPAVRFNQLVSYDPPSAAWPVNWSVRHGAQSVSRASKARAGMLPKLVPPFSTADAWLSPTPLEGGTLGSNQHYVVV